MSILNYLQRIKRIFIAPVAEPVTQNIGRREKAQQFVAALGGKDNISSIDACITRLRLVLRNRSKINETQLKALGSKGNVKLGDNALQVILGPEAEIIADEMKTL
ncbi:hypothetical protein FHQ30_12390 [Pasteurellaceae bacterium Phil11]|nr:hypothetical protein FHQ30_12390 [Pasteurellaceae bacterium Phil11]TNH19332.1 hypothetical protein FHQ29_12730 [Testudinibacter sp. TR-2022]